jgi:tryptophan 2-monooxygenase
MRIIINKLEKSKKLIPGGIKLLPEGFQSMCLSDFSEKFKFYHKTPIHTILRQFNQDNSQESFSLISASGKFDYYTRIIMATTTRSMELNTNITNFEKRDIKYNAEDTYLISDDTAESVRRVHMVPSIKVAARIKRYWGNNSNAIRVVLSDNIIQQIYTIDYGESDTGVCFITYSWEDNAIKQQLLGFSEKNIYIEPHVIYKTLLAHLAGMGTQFVQLSTKLQAIDDESVFYANWQSAPYFGGAFKLSQPGQDPYVQTMFYDYQKCLAPNRDTGVYLAGDCLAWNSGWIEGGLQTALNAVAGVIISTGGTLNPDANGLTPLSINPAAFSYFPGT